MSDFKVKELELEGVRLITPFYREDSRGYFLKSLERDVYQGLGLSAEIYESFESYSKKNVLRGMHFQTQNPQIKLVRVIVGTIYDVILDLRKDSPTFGKWRGIELTDQNHLCLWIPAGFAHGFRVISEAAIVSYQCIGKYLSDCDSGIKYNDPNIAIDWGAGEPIVSEKDNRLQSFEEFIRKYQCI
ncbi:MAG: dTDP-4-dehydrorhamnose 3 [Herbinix sp.]|jgi:dTDP-4-dehydrorhamnose 3,5-epimerase|nr:dTDP-4-dehydrorhamnose 3 [Herbinix sp.]